VVIFSDPKLTHLFVSNSSHCSSAKVFVVQNAEDVTEVGFRLFEER
jgi:hypothetical protein